MRKTFVLADSSIDVAGGGQMKATGNIVDHEYVIDRDGQTVATVSKPWFRCGTPTE